MPSRHSRNGRKNKDNSDVVYQQPTPSSRSPNTRSIPLPELEENLATPFSATPPISTSPVVQESHYEELTNARAALPTPPLVEVDSIGLECEGQNHLEVVEREQSVVDSVAVGNEAQSLLDDLSGATGAIEDTSDIQDVSVSSGIATGLIRPSVTQRSPSSSPAPVSTPAPTPERQTPVSSPRSHKKAAVAKIPSPKSSVHSPTSSQTLAPHLMPVPTSATAVGVPSPPMVSRPVSFGQFTASSKRGESTSAVADEDPMEGTIRPSSSRKRIPTRRPPEEDAFDGQYQAHSNRRMSYAGRSHVERQENHYPRQHSRHGTERQRSHSGISRAMGSGVTETGRVREIGDSIIWARWDLELRGRRLLFIGYYPFGLQIWDCTELDAVSEVLNLPLEKILEIPSAPELDLEYAGIIPPPPSQDPADSLKEYWPLVGILVSNAEELPKSRSKLTTARSSQFFVYSLSKHCIVKQVEIPGLVAGGGKFAIGDGFLVVSTTIPPALHLLSSSTFDVLHKISSSALIPFSHSSTGQFVSPTTSESGPSPTTSRRHSFWGTTTPTSNEPYSSSSGYSNNAHGFHDNNHLYNDSVLLSSSTYLDPSSPILHLSPPQPTPVYSVHGRLLAYASSSNNSGSGGDAYAQHSGLGVPPSLSSGAAALLSTGASTARSASMAALGSLSEQLAHLNRGGGGSGMSAGITQADLGNAAIKVGGGLLSGMKSLGGMAYKGAVSAASAAARSGHGGNGGAGDGMSNSRSGVSAFTNRFFSKSAPAAILPGTIQRRYSVNAGYNEERGGEVSGGGGNVSTAAQSAENGWSVTVLDLEPLLLSGTKENLSSASPIIVTRFIGSRTQPIAEMWFSQDGNSIMVAPKDGQMVHIFSIRSIPVTRILQQQEDGQTTEEGGEDSSSAHKKRYSNPFVPDAPPLHVYDLRRGITPGVVESASWSLDGRWAAFATRNRTVHVFAVNPYGGRSDARSHLEGLVRNYSEIPPPTTDLQPLVRLRVTKYPGPDQLQVPLALTFLDSPWITELTMPLNLLPPMTSPSLMPSHPAVGSHSYGSASSAHTVFSSSSPSTRSESMSPNSQPNGQRPKNYQDVLLFDPTDGVLSLRRVTANPKIKPRDGSTSILGTGLMGGSSAAGHISRSLPGMGAVGKLATSVSPTSQVRSTSSGTSQAIDVDVSELVGKESIVANWTLKRKREWSEVKGGLELPVRKVISKEKVGKADWLAQAELSTFSKSSRVLPRSIYLTHQFSFQALGEDYHALIRRYQFDIPGRKIEVRKGVEVSAYPTGTGESFVEAGGGFRRDTRRLSSSFDEPLASAIAGELDYSPTQPVLPMLPNGTPGSKPRTFKSSIPIKSLGDGMSESIGRFRREINKVRSPRLIPSADNSISVSVPLEFDEEDEDFMLKEPNGSTTKEPSSETHEGPSARTVTPPTGRLDEEDTWVGGNDAAGVEDAETFDHISAAGFFDEEQQVSMLEPSKVSKGKRGKKKQQHLN